MRGCAETKESAPDVFGIHHPSHPTTECCLAVPLHASCQLLLFAALAHACAESALPLPPAPVPVPVPVSAAEFFLRRSITRNLTLSLNVAVLGLRTPEATVKLSRPCTVTVADPPAHTCSCSQGAAQVIDYSRCMGCQASLTICAHFQFLVVHHCCALTPLITK